MKNTVLDDLKIVKKYDRSKMLETIESFPVQCEYARSRAVSFTLPESYRIPYRNIICSGLGGSAIGPDILGSYLRYEAQIPITVNRGYQLPAFVDGSALVVISSYSGDTEETISAYRDAKKKSAKIVVITSGGKLRKMAAKDGNAVMLLPGGFQPRCAFGYSFFSALVLLSRIGVIKDKTADISETIKILDGIRRQKAGSGVAKKNNIAKKTASLLYGKFPVIYASSDNMDCAVARWRGELAENSKTLSSGNFFPEMNHNEIVGWEEPAKLLKDFAVVMLRDSLDHPRIAKRMDITRDILKSEGVRVIEVVSLGRSRLARIFSLLYIGDFVSFYLAMLNGVDPTPVDRITRLKKKLAGID